MTSIAAFAGLQAPKIFIPSASTGVAAKLKDWSIDRNHLQLPESTIAILVASITLVL